jgi:hypothetical protein
MQPESFPLDWQHGWLFFHPGDPFMSLNSDEAFLRQAQKRLQDFLDCLALLLARRWLQDQRRSEDKPQEDQPSGETENE